MHAQKISLVKNIERLWCHYINSYSSNQLEEKGQGKEGGYQIQQTQYFQMVMVLFCHQMDSINIIAFDEVIQ